MSKLLLILMLIATIACSSNEQDEDLLVEDVLVSDENEILIEEEEDLSEAGVVSDVPPSAEEDVDEDITANVEEEELQSTEQVESDDVQFSYYKVQKGDTLMMIAFKVYGDYTKWKSIFEHNKELLKHQTVVEIDMNLKFEVPESEFNWSPVGSPYLIQKGQTLGTISKDVYASTKYWKNIFDNNRALIRDPNLIFAGFTIYYKDLEEVKVERGLSSK